MNKKKYDATRMKRAACIAITLTLATLYFIWPIFDGTFDTATFLFGRDIAAMSLCCGACLIILAGGLVNKILEKKTKSK
ncbi:hypothetical protein bpr_II074 (plasmid) [Butyrivibrio proteoclasticus B316]|uniref:Uncharacterized protein n=1 Tax=Butyrivibrio proteoclasticus (strain ATCC 51982 / DSM 14932 / B316) TaxID=515622 RepID=E0S3N2_BUTPB|nr:hypothetical protein [Butyrivibrio proteoclasticus]ADL36014.1 hypothetical protein bpr_II074 [Butyrivibrio proteoclasticus B316]